MTTNIAAISIAAAKALGEVGAAADVVNITSFITGNAVISAGVDRSEWESGIARIDDFRFTLQNTDGKFDNGIGRGNAAPFFASGRGGGYVAAKWGAVDLFAGDIAAVADNDDVLSNTADITALSLINRLRGYVVGDARIANGMTARQALAALQQDAAQAGLTAGAINIPAGIDGIAIIGYAGWFVQRNLYEAVNSICRACGITASVDAAGALRFDISETAIGAAVIATSPTKLKVENGARRSANAITIRRAADDRAGITELRQTKRHADSVRLYGERPVSIEADWITDTAISSLLTSLLSLRAEPRDLLRATFRIGDIPANAIGLLRRIRIRKFDEYTGSPPSLDSADGATFGDDFAVRTVRGIDFTGVCLYYRIDLTAGNCDIVLARL